MEVGEVIASINPFSAESKGKREAKKQIKQSAAERRQNRAETETYAKELFGENSDEYKKFMGDYDNTEKENVRLELEGNIEAQKQAQENQKNQRIANQQYANVKKEVATQGTEAKGEDGGALVADTVTEALDKQQNKDDIDTLKKQSDSATDAMAGSKFLKEQSENKDYADNSTAEAVQNEIENASADEVLETANDAVMNTLDEFKKNSQLDKESLEASKKYADNVGQSLYARYKRGDFGDADSKEAKRAFGTLLTNAIGSMLYNAGSAIKGDSSRVKSTIEDLDANDIENAMERKNKADEQELEKVIRDQNVTESDLKQIKDDVNALRKDEIFGPYSAKMDTKTKIWAAQANAAYGKHFQDNPEIAGHIAAAVTSGNPEYISKSIDAIDSMKNLNAQDAQNLKNDIVRSIIESAHERGLKNDEAIYDYLVRFNIANKVGLNNAKELTEFNIESARGKFMNRVARGAENYAGNAVKSLGDAALTGATGLPISGK